MLKKIEVVKLLKETILNLSKSNVIEDIFRYDGELTAYLKVLNDDVIYNMIEDSDIKGLLEYIDKIKSN